MWTGGNDLTDEGIYVWPDGTEVYLWKYLSNYPQISQLCFNFIFIANLVITPSSFPQVLDFAGLAWEHPQPDNAKYIKGYEQDVLQFSKWGTFDDSFVVRERYFACQCANS